MKYMVSVLMICLLLAGIGAAKINLPRADEFKLDNGLTVQVIERHSLPLFSFEMVIKAGSICDPDGKEGLARLSNEMLMSGTTTRTTRQIAEDIAYVGATISNFCNHETTGFSGETLSDKGERLFEVVGDILTNSTFTPEEFEKVKNRQISALRGQLDDAGDVANAEIVRELLSPGPFAHLPLGTIKGVESLTRQDVIGFVKRFYTPDNCILVVCGDIDRKTLKGYVEKYIGGWSGKATGSSHDIKSDFNSISGREILILDKPDATQTQIRMGLIGLSRDHEDYIPFELARTVYAGSFTSRLVNEIRVNRGLSYGVGCRSNRYSTGGIIYVSTFTKNESVAEVIDIILAESKRMQTEPVPDSELVGARNYRNGLYPLRFETNDDIAGIFGDIWFYNLDKGHFENFQEKISKVDQNQAMRAANEYFPFGAYKLVLVGKADEIRSQVEKYGNVTVRPIAGM